MKRSTPVPPALNQELQRWQRQSESKIPPGAPRPRIHELPGMAAENEAAATPTIDEAVPVSGPDVPSPPDEDPVTQGEETPEARKRGHVKEAVLQRFEDDGGCPDGDESGAGPFPRRVDPALG